jgi:hypothetical protein
MSSAKIQSKRPGRRIQMVLAIIVGITASRLVSDHIDSFWLSLLAGMSVAAVAAPVTVLLVQRLKVW